MATYKELLAQQQELTRQIEEARVSEVSSAVEKVQQLIAEYGLTAQDVFPQSPKARASKSASKGSTVAAKFRDPISGSTWSGRGLAPKWLKGKNKEDFAI